METALSLFLGVGLSAACGFRVFVPLLVMSLAARTGHLTLAATLEEDFPLEGTFRAGPVRLRPFFLIKNTGYDSNVFLSANEQVSDFTSTLGPGLKLLTLFGDRGALLLTQELDYVWFAQYTSATCPFLMARDAASTKNLVFPTPGGP